MSKNKSKKPDQSTNTRRLRQQFQRPYQSKEGPRHQGWHHETSALNQQEHLRIEHLYYHLDLYAICKGIKRCLNVDNKV